MYIVQLSLKCVQTFGNNKVKKTNQISKGVTESTKAGRPSHALRTAARGLFVARRKCYQSPMSWDIHYPNNYIYIHIST